MQPFKISIEIGGVQAPSSESTASASTMSNFSSASYSFSSTSRNVNGRVSGTRRTEQVTSDGSGTTMRTSSQNLGEAPVQEVRHFDSRGREVLGGPTADTSRRIEDVSESEQAGDQEKQARE